MQLLFVLCFEMGLLFQTYDVELSDGGVEPVDAGGDGREKENVGGASQRVSSSNVSGSGRAAGSRSADGTENDSRGSDSNEEGSGGSDRHDGKGGDPPDGDGDDPPNGDDPEEEENKDEAVDEEAATEAAEDQEVQVASSNPGSPVCAQGKNWLSYESLMEETYPSKSKEIYLSAFRDFELFLKSENQYAPNVVPTETMLLNYFRYLKTVKRWVATSIWSQYSRINGVLKLRFGFSLKDFPSVTDLLKSYEVGHRVKKASVFSPQQIEDMIVDPELTSRYWIVRKVICLIGYYGGLRSIELRSIEFRKIFESGEKSFDVDNAGYWFSFERGKQRGLPVVSSFCVPRRQVDWVAPISSSDRNPVDYDPASVIDLYLELVELDLNSTRDKLSGCFFKSAHGKSGKFYRNVPMGKNLIKRVGREFAEELVLPNPATFTSH
jgi:hypothetical protein